MPPPAGPFPPLPLFHPLPAPQLPIPQLPVPQMGNPGFFTPTTGNLPWASEALRNMASSQSAFRRIGSSECGLGKHWIRRCGFGKRGGRSYRCKKQDFGKRSFRRYCFSDFGCIGKQNFSGYEKYGFSGCEKCDFYDSKKYGFYGCEKYCFSGCGKRDFRGSTMSNEALGSKFLTNVLPLYNMLFCFPESLVSQKLAKKLEGMTQNGNLFCVKNIQIL
jgi:hypothetical protein